MKECQKQKAYLDELPAREHTIKVAFSDEGKATTKFTIKEKQQNVTPEDNKNTENTKDTEKEKQPSNNNVTKNDIQKDKTITNPKTGDIYIVLFAIAILGLIIVNVKKSKNSRKH